METTATAPVKQARVRKPRPKPARHVGISVRPSEVNPFFVLRIAEGKQLDYYTAKPIPSDWGTAFEMTKLGSGQEVPYHVCLAGADSVCDCKGHLRHGHCRHVEGLNALKNAGRL
jgi:hypothetical protein